MLFLRKLSLVFVSALLCSASMTAAQAAQWDVTTVTTSDETPLGHDCRRRMAVGYYDEGANKTFASFTGENMVPQVASYDHAADQWSDPVSVSMHSETDDAHDYSHIFQMGDGRVGLTSSDHNEKLYFAKSENPGSIDGNWSVSEIGNDLEATYPMPMNSRDNDNDRIDILYRETKSPTDYRPINRVSSTDNGETWSSPRPAIDYNNSRDDHLNEIYLGAMSHEADHPDASLGEGYHATWTIAGGGPGNHSHNDYHKNMYYAYYNFDESRWYAADGTDLGYNIDDSDAENHCKVFDSGSLEGNNKDGEIQDIGYRSKAVLDSDGNPVVAFQNGKTNSIDIGMWNDDEEEWDVTTPSRFEDTRGLHDMVSFGGDVWLLVDNGNGADIVQILPDGSTEDIGQYSPPLNANDNFFIDNANSEAFILSIRDESDGAVYSVSNPIPEPGSFILLVLGVPVVLLLGGRRRK